jgi:hypothetical protein
MSPPVQSPASSSLTWLRLLPACIYLLLAGACLSGLFAYAQTGTTTSTTTTSSSTGTGTTTTTIKKHAAAHCTYKGTVASDDATAKSFVVHPAKGDDVTLKVNDKTKYSPKGKGWDDVKADAKVSGACHKDGADNWAVTVKFRPEEAAKPPKRGSDEGHGDWPPVKKTGT